MDLLSNCILKSVVYFKFLSNFVFSNPALNGSTLISLSTSHRQFFQIPLILQSQIKNVSANPDSWSLQPKNSCIFENPERNFVFTVSLANFLNSLIYHDSKMFEVNYRLQGVQVYWNLDEHGVNHVWTQITKITNLLRRTVTSQKVYLNKPEVA